MAVVAAATTAPAALVAEESSIWDEDDHEEPAETKVTPWDACLDRVTEYPDHTLVRGPKFAVGQPALTSIAVDPGNMGSLAVTNGVEVHLSDDAGCTWAQAFKALQPGNAGPPAVVGREGDQVRAVVPVRVVPLLGPQGVFVPRMYVRDGAVESMHDMPPEMAAQECSDARRCLVRFAPGLDAGYAATPGFGDVVFARVASTVDGGRTWTVNDAPTVDTRTVPVADLAVDPADDAHVLAIAGGRLFESRDRAKTWTQSKVPTTLSPLARVVFTPGTVPPRKVAREAVVADRMSGGTAVFVSADGGRTFTDSGSVVPADPLRDLVLGLSPMGPSLVVAAGGRLFREGYQSGFDTLLPQGPAITQVTATHAGMWLRRAGALVWVDGSYDPTALPLLSNRPGPFQGTPAGELRSRPGGGTLHVPGRLTVPPGQSAVTVVTADLARQPRGLDVFFLVDTSGSMSAKLQPMANAMARVVDALNREGIAARFGLGEHGASSFRYRRHADLGTPPEEVRRKLAGLQSSGGEEYHYTALYQIATGKGMQAVTGGSIPPGQQASFEPGALHVVVHATDEPDNTDPEGPSEATALAALNDVDVRHVGIYPGGTASPTDATYQALVRYAVGTSTFAPAGGLDCDGNGATDIDEGEPIACAIPGNVTPDAPIASLLERVLLSLSRREPVTMAHHPSPLGVRIAPLGNFRAVDLHEKHAGLEFRVQVTCPPEQHGRDVDVPLDLLVGEAIVATAPLPVTCLAERQPLPPPPVEEPEPPLRRPAPRVLPALPPIASAPPALAQSTATAQASSTASQGAQASQVGMAVAPDEELQAATEEEDVHFVAHTGLPTTAPAVGAAFLMALALLYAAQTRVATAAARTRDWRDRRW